MNAKEDRQRSQALSYAKDLFVAYIAKGDCDNLDLTYSKGIIELAKTFFAFIKGIDTTKDNPNVEIGVEE
jgi:hypothetical protein